MEIIEEIVNNSAKKNVIFKETEGLSNTLKNSYEVMLELASKTCLYWQYYYHMGELLKKNGGLFNNHTYFLKDSQEAYLNYIARCLMLLCEEGKKNLGIKKFLTKLKQELPLKQTPSPIMNTSQYSEILNHHLAQLEKEDYIEIQKKLKIMRDKKYFHIDYENAIGKPPIDQLTKNPTRITEEEIKFLVDLIKNIVSAYGKLFDKTFDHYIANLTSIKDTFNKLEAFFQIP